MPPDDKSQKRVEKLFSDLEQIARQSCAMGENISVETPLLSNVEIPMLTNAQTPVLSSVETGSTPPAANEAPVFPSTNHSSATIDEMHTLRLRIHELEAQLNTAPAPSLLYENKEVGFAYSNNHVLPLQMTAVAASAGNSENIVKTPLTASGETIGEMQIEPPSERAWTTEEKNLASAVAQQASLQIQNLRLLTAAERARAEAQAANRQFTHQNWESFMDGVRNSERIGYVYDQASVAPFGESVPAEHDFQETVKVLDEQVGNLFLKADPARPLTDEDKEMVSAVARQISQQVENLRLLAEASRARANAEEATRRLTRENWQSFTNQKNDGLGFAYDSIQVTPYGETHTPEDISFAQPLMVRGETIGQLTVAGLKDVPSDAHELANNIAERVSAHIENLRLFELNEKRARELETVAVVSTTASTVLDPDELLQSVVDLTKERFNLYHAHIYLADKSWDTLMLASGAGEVGRQMVAEGWAIPMNHALSIVANAARKRQFIIANNISHAKHTGFLSNYLLPDTRSEMAIPMIVGENLLGVFDVQADTANYFSEEDARIYTTLAAQVAIALQNARLYMEQAATVTQLRELDRLKSSFLANMSHELRTPLNSILGFADVMLEGLDGPLTENMNNDLGLIQKNGQHLLHLINDVLDMAKIDSGKMNLHVEKFNVHDLFADVTSITSSLAKEKSIALVIDAESDREVEINADKIRLRQVMINLVNNAMKFTEKGQVTICAHREENNILISVKDSGIGIPADHLELVFQEFTQVDTTTTRKAGGTGLGLPISRRLINMHSGRLWAESSGIHGEGSTFYVHLPIEANINENVTLAAN